MSYLNAYVVKMRMEVWYQLQKSFEVLKEDYKIYRFHNVNPISAVFKRRCTRYANI
jgi:glycosyltransferase